MRQTDCFPHQLFHCNALSPLVYICCYSSHLSLRHRFGKNHPCWLDLLGLFYLYWAGCISTVYCYGYVSLHGLRTLILWPMYCILLGQEVLSPGLCFSILTIPVQALSSCTHNHTTYLVCSHGNQQICFNSSLLPLGAMVRDQEHPQPWEPCQLHAGV
jgi:hypothetical protein